MSCIYIAGRIRGDKDYVRKFMDAEAELRAKGWHVHNPARTDPEMDLRDIMVRNLVCLLTSGAVYALPDSAASPGAKIELALANYCGITVYRGMDAVPDLYDMDDLPFADAVPPGEAAYDFWADDTD